MPKKYRPISFNKVKTCRLKSRQSKVRLDKVGKPFAEGSFSDFIDSLPDILSASDFKSAVKAIAMAHKKDRPVVLGMGAHPIKVGLSPIIINLMEKGVITAIAMNGACIIHDYELALMGHTSEDVDVELCKGTFGMAEETGKGTSAREMTSTGAWSERDPQDASIEQGRAETMNFVDAAVRFIERWKALRPTEQR